MQNAKRKKAENESVFLILSLIFAFCILHFAFRPWRPHGRI